MKLDEPETEATKNHRYNGAMPPIGTKASSPNSPLTENSVDPDKPPSCPRIYSGDSSVLACVVDLLEVRLQGANTMLFGVYQDWVHQNPGNHLNGGII